MREPGWRAGTGSGQASIEMLALLPVILVVGALTLQLLGVGRAVAAADGAAEAGALAVAAGKPVEPAVRAALPDWPRNRLDVRASGGRIVVRLRVRPLFADLGPGIRVSGSAWALPPDER